MRLNESAARAVVALVDPPPSEAHTQVLVKMLQAHLDAFEAVERLDLEGVDLSANFEAQSDA
jgi:hypothetical protein